MYFSDFAIFLKRLEDTPSRLEITAILKELFEKIGKDEIRKATYLSLGILAPNYDGVLLNLAEKMVARAIAIAYDKDLEIVTKEYKKLGDLGNVASQLANNSKLQINNSKLTVSEVFQKLLSIAKDSGEGSQDRKIELMADLLKNLDPLSVRYVTRIPVGKLRLGFSEKTILDALRQAQGKSSEDEIESAYNVRPDIGYVAEMAKSQKLNAIRPVVGVPVVPMLAQRLNSTSEMIKKMGEVAVEPKFDGLRIFIHYKKPDFIKIFTRNMNYLNPDIFPELKQVGKYIKADEIILDTEAVGLDHKRQMFVDFQKTISRRRKHDVEKTSVDIPLQFQVFDCLLIDDQSLIDKSYIERRKLLEEVIVNGELLRVDESIVTSDPQVIKKLHQKYLKMGLEGVVVKRADSKYVSGRTGWNWVKMKEVEGTRGKLSDTVDLVIMGFTAGKGKRAGFGVGQFLAGIFDEKNDKFQTVTKVGTGITDELFKKLNTDLKKIKILHKPKEYDVHKDLTPDFWVEPKVVVELAADEITESPKHTSGFALRFPRLIGFRPDKLARHTTSIDELKTLSKMQRN